MRNIINVPFIFLLFLIFIYFHMLSCWLKKSQRKEHKERHKDVTLLVCPYWGEGCVTGHAGLKMRLFMSTSLKDLLGSPRVFT